MTGNYLRAFFEGKVGGGGIVHIKLQQNILITSREQPLPSTHLDINLNFFKRLIFL